MAMETENLIIRKANESDVEFLAEISTNEKVQKYTGGVIDSYENTLDHINRHPENIDGFHIIELKGNRERIGIVSFVPNNYMNEEEILISIMPTYWGNEYGPETLSVFKGLWLESNNIKHMFATVKPGNTASISMLMKEGFVFVEVYEDPFQGSQSLYKYERSYT